MAGGRSNRCAKAPTGLPRRSDPMRPVSRPRRCWSELLLRTSSMTTYRPPACACSTNRGNRHRAFLCCFSPASQHERRLTSRTFRDCASAVRDCVLGFAALTAVKYRGDRLERARKARGFPGRRTASHCRRVIDSCQGEVDRRAAMLFRFGNSRIGRIRVNGNTSGFESPRSTLALPNSTPVARCHSELVAVAITGRFRINMSTSQDG